MAIEIQVKVITRSSQTKIVEQNDKFLKIKLKSAPTKGAANKELIKLLAKKFKVSQSQIKIIKGLTSKSKVVKID